MIQKVRPSGHMGLFAWLGALEKDLRRSVPTYPCYDQPSAADSALAPLQVGSVWAESPELYLQ